MWLQFQEYTEADYMTADIDYAECIKEGFHITAWRQIQPLINMIITITGSIREYDEVFNKQMVDRDMPQKL